MKRKADKNMKYMELPKEKQERIKELTAVLLRKKMSITLVKLMGCFIITVIVQALTTGILQTTFTGLFAIAMTALSCSYVMLMMYARNPGRFLTNAYCVELNGNYRFERIGGQDDGELIECRLEAVGKHLGNFWCNFEVELARPLLFIHRNIRIAIK